MGAAPSNVNAMQQPSLIELVSDVKTHANVGIVHNFRVASKNMLTMPTLAA